MVRSKLRKNFLKSRFECDKKKHAINKETNALVY